MASSLRPNTSNLIRLPKPNTSLIPRSPMYSAISLWNSLPNNFRTINARTTFHSALKEHFCWVYVHPLIYPHTFSLYRYPVPYQTDVPASSTFIQAFTPSPTPPSISFTPRHLFFISPFTLAVLLGYWARVENNNNNNNNPQRIFRRGSVQCEHDENNQQNTLIGRI